MNFGPLISGLLQFAKSNQSGNTANKLAEEMIQRSDPFASRRGRYADALQNAEDAGFRDPHPTLSLPNPGDITSIPGYQAGLEAVQRAGAAQGFTGSGNMMVALQKYGGDFYNKERQFALDKYNTEYNTFKGDFGMYETELNRLGHLAGGDVNPGQGFATAANLIGQGQASSAFGDQALLSGIMSALGGMGGISPNFRPSSDTPSFSGDPGTPVMPEGIPPTTDSGGLDLSTFDFGGNYSFNNPF